MLIAEELVLLALETDGTLARGMANQPSVAIGVTGALIAELAIDGHVMLEDGRIRLTGTRPTHPLLAQVLDDVATHEDKKPKSRLVSITHSGWSEVVEALIADGVLGEEKHTLRPTRHPVLAPAAHQALLAAVRAAAIEAGPLSLRLAMLLALAGPCQMLEVVAPERGDRKAAKARIARASERVPAAAAVGDSIEAVAAAAVATIAASTVASAG